MTTARRSRSRQRAALALALAAIAVVPASAHRRDEYLQAARIAIEPRRVLASLVLTPGIAIANGLLGEIDSNRDRRLAPEETRAYAARVLSEIQLSLDGRPLALALVSQQFAEPAALLTGEGMIQLEFCAAVPSLDVGAHRLVFSNRHRADISAYLANALSPEDRRVIIVDQTRDTNQRELSIDYALRVDPVLPIDWLAPAIGGLLATLAVARFLQARRPLPNRHRRVGPAPHRMIALPTRHAWTSATSANHQAGHGHSLAPVAGRSSGC